MRSPVSPSSSEEGAGGGGTQGDVLRKRASEMRQNPTEPEKRLWFALRGKRLSGYKFRRQKVIGNRIVDFFCPAKALIIEVDGDTHNDSVDKQRDYEMKRRYGYATVRFSNHEVMTNMEGVLMHLLEKLRECDDRWSGRNHPLTPSFEKEGEE